MFKALNFLEKLNPQIPIFEVHLHGSILKDRHEYHIPIFEDAELKINKTIEYLFSHCNLKFPLPLILEYFSKEELGEWIETIETVVSKATR